MVGHMKAGFKPETFEEIYGSVNHKPGGQGCRGEKWVVKK